jgi:hypothetical protein
MPSMLRLVSAGALFCDIDFDPFANRCYFFYYVAVCITQIGLVMLLR